MILTRFALAGAVVMFSAWLAITGGRWLTRAMAALRPYLAAFVIFTFIAMNYAQKPGGTNDPPQGAGSPLHLLHFSKHIGSRTEPTWSWFYGPMITHHAESVQTTINAWEGDDAGLYQVQVIDLSVFDDLANQ